MRVCWDWPCLEQQGPGDRDGDRDRLGLSGGRVVEHLDARADGGEHLAHEMSDAVGRGSEQVPEGVQRLLQVLDALLDALGVVRQAAHPQERLHAATDCGIVQVVDGQGVELHWDCLLLSDCIGVTVVGGGADILHAFSHHRTATMQVEVPVCPCTRMYSVAKVRV